MPKLHLKDLILYEDEHYILINKPPFIATLDERNPDGNPLSIINLVHAYNVEAKVGHRLDKETSGVLAIAKHLEAYKHLASQFEARTVKKVYHAVISGIKDLQEVEVDLPILRLSGGLVKISHQKGKEAQTSFKTLKFFKKHTLLECRPLTGRTHQIRIHLSSMGSPIVCDTAYGGEMLYLSSLKKKKFNLKKQTEELPLIKRVALHAYSLSFESMDGKNIFVEAPYPKDFNILIKQLEKFEG